jgi:hypothetical protein
VPASANSASDPATTPNATSASISPGDERERAAECSPIGDRPLVVSVVMVRHPPKRKARCEFLRPLIRIA